MTSNMDGEPTTANLTHIQHTMVRVRTKLFDPKISTIPISNHSPKARRRSSQNCWWRWSETSRKRVVAHALNLMCALPQFRRLKRQSNYTCTHTAAIPMTNVCSIANGREAREEGNSRQLKSLGRISKRNEQKKRSGKQLLARGMRNICL